MEVRRGTDAHHEYLIFRKDSAVQYVPVDILDDNSVAKLNAFLNS